MFHRDAVTLKPGLARNVFNEKRFVVREIGDRRRSELRYAAIEDLNQPTLVLLEVRLGGADIEGRESYGVVARFEVDRYWSELSVFLVPICSKEQRTPVHAVLKHYPINDGAGWEFRFVDGVAREGGENHQGAEDCQRQSESDELGHCVSTFHHATFLSDRVLIPSSPDGIFERTSTARSPRRASILVPSIIPPRPPHRSSRWVDHSQESSKSSTPRYGSLVSLSKVLIRVRRMQCL